MTIATLARWVALRGLPYRRVGRFLTTGAVAFALDFGGLVFLREIAGWPLRWCVATAYVIGGAVHYSLTRWWVFPPDSPMGERGRIVRYLLLGAFNAAANVVMIVALAGAGVDYRIAKVLAVGTLVVFNYFAMPRWVMR